MTAEARTDSYWVGSLAMTVALASQDPNPHPLLKTALREFMSEGAAPQLKEILHAALKEKP